MNNLYKKKKYKLMTVIILVIIISILYDNFPGFTCDYWDLGLNNSRIYNDENKYPCEVLHLGKNN